MSGRLFRLVAVVGLVAAILIVGTVYAGPKPLSGAASRTSTECGLWWFDSDWELVWIEGQGQQAVNAAGGSTVVCRFTLDLSDPALLSRDDFCAEDWAKFMCKGDGALVDSHTTCNDETGTLHKGTVVASPSGEGTLTCLFR